MKNTIVAIVALIQVFSISSLFAEVQLQGYFIARSDCQAYQSIKKQTNPGNISTKSNYAYKLLSINKENGSHYKIEMDAAPKHRWIKVSCGEHVVAVGPVITPTPTDTPITTASPTPTPSLGNKQYVLAISWQPAFCETRPGKAECQNQTNADFEATNFTLHGLWPQPRGNDYCNVSAENEKKDKQKKWDELPVLTLSDDTRNKLKVVMPGYESFLHRHEWIKHGTCYGHTAEKYYVDSLKLMEAINASKLKELFADNISQNVSYDEITKAFNNTFDSGAADRIKVTCKRDGNRTLITEMLIKLEGNLDQLELKQAIANAQSFPNNGCDSGIVDPIGNQ